MAPTPYPWRRSYRAHRSTPADPTYHQQTRHEPTNGGKDPLMKPVTRLATGAVAGALCLALAACGGAGGQQASDDDLDTITLMVPVLDAQAPAADGALHKAIEEFSEKTLQITWVPNSNYGERTNVTLASDNIPELMVVQGKTPAFVRSAQAGAFWDLTDRLANYPNLVSATPSTQENASINGQVFGVYRLRDPMRAAVVVRKDWLDNLGLEMPETTQDLYDIAKAFTEGDPDGNGQADTYGLIIPRWPGGYASASPYDVIETWYGAPNGWGERDGQLVPGFMTPEFLEANRFMKQMIDEGLVNPDFATMDSANWNDPFFNGRGGIIVDVSSRANALMNLFKQQDPENFTDYVDMSGNLIGPSGDKHSYPTIGYNGFIAISRQSVTTEDELDNVLKFLNDMSSQEGQVLQNNGIEGTNFTVEGDYAVPITGGEADVVTNDSKSFAQMGTNTNGYLAYLTKPATPEEEAFLEAPGHPRRGYADRGSECGQPLRVGNLRGARGAARPDHRGCSSPVPRRSDDRGAVAVGGRALAR